MKIIALLVLLCVVANADKAKLRQPSAGCAQTLSQLDNQATIYKQSAEAAAAQVLLIKNEIAAFNPKSPNESFQPSEEVDAIFAEVEEQRCEDYLDFIGFLVQQKEDLLIIGQLRELLGTASFSAVALLQMKQLNSYNNILKQDKQSPLHQLVKNHARQGNSFDNELASDLLDILEENVNQTIWEAEYKALQDAWELVDKIIEFKEFENDVEDSNNLEELQQDLEDAESQVKAYWTQFTDVMSAFNAQAKNCTGGSNTLIQENINSGIPQSIFVQKTPITKQAMARKRTIQTKH